MGRITVLSNDTGQGRGGQGQTHFALSQTGPGVQSMAAAKLGVFEKVVTLKMLQFLVPEVDQYIRMYGLPVVLLKLKGYFHLLAKNASARDDLKNEQFEIDLWIQACVEALQSLGNTNLPEKSYGDDVFKFFFSNGARVFPPLGNICDALMSRP